MHRVLILGIGIADHPRRVAMEVLHILQKCNSAIFSSKLCPTSPPTQFVLPKPSRSFPFIADLYGEGIQGKAQTVRHELPFASRNGTSYTLLLNTSVHDAAPTVHSRSMDAMPRRREKKKTWAAALAASQIC